MTENTDVTSFEFIYTFSGDNDEFVLNMVNLFLQQCPIMLHDLELAILDSNWKETGNLAHKFITSVKFMGMSNVASQLKLIENNARSSIDLENITNIFLTVKETCIKAIEELERKKYSLQNSL